MRLLLILVMFVPMFAAESQPNIIIAIYCPACVSPVCPIFMSSTGASSLIPFYFQCQHHPFNNNESYIPWSTFISIRRNSPHAHKLHIIASLGFPQCSPCAYIPSLDILCLVPSSSSASSSSYIISRNKCTTTAISFHPIGFQWRHHPFNINYTFIWYQQLFHYDTRQCIFIQMILCSLSMTTTYVQCQMDNNNHNHLIHPHPLPSSRSVIIAKLSPMTNNILLCDGSLLQRCGYIVSASLQ